MWHPEDACFGFVCACMQYRVLRRNNFRCVEYVHTYMHMYIIIYICVHTMHHKLLVASVLGTSMICTKHRFSTIYDACLFSCKQY